MEQYQDDLILSTTILGCVQLAMAESKLCTHPVNKGLSQTYWITIWFLFCKMESFFTKQKSIQIQKTEEKIEIGAYIL